MYPECERVYVPPLGFLGGNMWAKRFGVGLTVAFLGCGGGGGTSAPTSPSTPAPVANSMTATANATLGGSIATVACPIETGSCTSGLVVTVDVVFNTAVSGRVYLQILDGAGRQCGSRESSAVSMTAGVSARFTFDLIRIECAR